MTQEYHGSFIHIQFDANELSDGRTTIQLADGYTDNIELSLYMPLERGDDITFPVVNGKSPSILPLLIKGLILDYPSKNLDKFQIHTILIPLLNQF